MWRNTERANFGEEPFHEITYTLTLPSVMKDDHIMSKAATLIPSVRGDSNVGPRGGSVLPVARFGNFASFRKWRLSR
jgi:hypothetical protein